MNYGKFKFEQAKREKENRKNQKVIEVKEIYLSMTIDIGDLNVKAKKTMEILGDGDKVKVEIGSVAHPMIEEHSILWVYLQTDKGGQRKNLAVGEAPVAEFSLLDEKPVAVYAYCNLHGLWKTEV